MLAGTLAFATGIVCLLQFSSLPPYGLVVIVPLCLILWLFYRKFKLISLFFLGFSWALFRMGIELAPAIHTEIDKGTHLLSGEVISIPQTYNDQVRFKFKIKKINGENLSLPIVVRLSWYKTKTTPTPGEVWQFKAKLKRPYGFMNPGGFDYEKWMLRQGVNFTGYIKNDPINRKLEKTSAYFMQKIRYEISEKLKQQLKQPLLGLALALSLGERGQLSQEQTTILKNTGTAHLVAISGLHLSLVFGVLFFTSRFLLSQLCFITEKVPAPTLAYFIAFVGAALYAALAGFALPTQRALIMIAAFIFSVFIGRGMMLTNVIAVAVALILILDPLAIVSADFWLSFMAVLIILYLTRFRISRRHRIIEWGRIQLFLSFALFPLLAFWFMQVPFYSVLANLIAVPLAGFVIVPLLLVALGLLFPFQQLSLMFYDIIAVFNDVFWSYLRFISELNNNVGTIAAPNLISLALAVLGVLILFMPKGLPARGLGLFFLLPLMFPTLDKPRQNEFDFSLLDVGQGLAALIQTKEHVLVFDTGVRFSERFNSGDAVLIPYLKFNGIQTISTLLLSHGDNDHVGGAQAIIKQIEIERILSSVPLDFSDKYVAICRAGQKWEWDGVKFEILHPHNRATFTGNNASCVLKIDSAHGSLLLTGDIEKEAEQSLLQLSANKLKADVLVVPHHGSKTSSTLEFIRQVDPKYAFFPVGYRNRFGFPKQDILLRYESRGIETRTTYQSGAISVKFRKNALTMSEYRKQNQRLWHQ